MEPAPHVTRSRLLEEIRTRPGSTIAELARAAHLPHSTATHHLRRLEAAGAVATVPLGGRRHHFDPGVPGAPDVVGARLPLAGAVLARVREKGPAPLGAIAHGLPLTKAGAYWHLLRLARLGLIEMDGPPGRRTYRVRAAAASSAAANSGAEPNLEAGSGERARAITAFSSGGAPETVWGDGAASIAARAASSSSPRIETWGRPASIR